MALKRSRVETKADDEIKFVNWSSECFSSGDVYRIWVQYTGNESDLLNISKYVKTFQNLTVEIDLENLLNEHDVDVLVKYGDLDDKLRYGKAKGKLTPPKKIQKILKDVEEKGEGDEDDGGDQFWYLDNMIPFFT
jgi:hypothetical protein